MSLTLSTLGIPREIIRLQEFGVGDFTADERLAKTNEIRRIMQRRPRLSHSPLFSVIVPAHRETKYLLATLRSLAEQTNKNAEFLIISNGEPFGNATQRLAESAGFRVIHEPQSGVARARQRGLLAARGKVVVTTDADTLHSHTWLDSIASSWKRGQHDIGGFGWVYPLSTSPLYQFCIQVQNVSRMYQGDTLLFGLAEANSWFLRDMAIQCGGYDVGSKYGEGSALFKKMLHRGHVSCTQEKGAAVYTSDRRALSTRMVAGAQYFLLADDPRRMQYQVIR